MSFSSVLGQADFQKCAMALLLGPEKRIVVLFWENVPEHINTGSISVINRQDRKKMSSFGLRKKKIPFKYGDQRVYLVCNVNWDSAENVSPKDNPDASQESA